jgi:GAF domain-containing protein
MQSPKSVKFFRVEPIPESSEAVAEFGPFEVDLLQNLQDMAIQVRDLVPDCVGLSLASREHGVSFTVVSSSEEIAALDGIQYVDGGPCVESVKAERVIAVEGEEMLGEAGWHLFAKATAAYSITSTLTLPIIAETQVVGSINLYAASPMAFSGHHEAIAEIFGAWAPGAVANADLGFRTLRTSKDAPRLLYEEMRIQVAVGIVMSAQSVTPDVARELLSDAARRARVTEALLAESLIAGIEGRDGSSLE